MANRKNILHAAAASALAVSLAVTPVCIQAAETESAALVQPVLDASEELLDTTAQSLDEAHEGYFRITAGDPLRAAISLEAGGTDDMAWIKNAEILFQQAPNESGGEDMEATLLFNDTELYHLSVSYDASARILYAVCPELQDQTMAVPFDSLSSSVQESVTQGISPEMMQQLGVLFADLTSFAQSVPADQLQQEMLKYIGTLGSHLTLEQGIATVTAGTLSAEANTMSYAVSEQDMQEMLPELLRMLSEDELLEQLMTSGFVNDLIALGMQQSGLNLGLTGEDLLNQIRPAIANLAEQDFSGMYGFRLTIGENDRKTAGRVSLALETSGISAELFSVDAVADGSDHAVEFRLGPVLASSMGLDTNTAAGIVAQGSVEQNLLNETVSVNAQGMQMNVLQISGLDLEQLREGRVVGTVTAAADNGTVTGDFKVSEEDGERAMDLYKNEDLWCTFAANMYAVQDVELDEIDVSDPAVVEDEKSLAAYMRNANVIRMLEKLADAGVPQEYVDKLTSSEASTESSRENVVETDKAS